MMSQVVILYTPLHHKFFFSLYQVAQEDIITVTFLSFQAIHISRITEGGAAEKDGKLQVGDRVTTVCIANFMYCYVLSVVLLVMLYAMM